MPDIRFRWPEEEAQHVEPRHLTGRSRKSDEYLDRWPMSILWPLRSDR
ncbi:MAG: hypothetical protein FWB88_13135 [Defluviitaleaceae bacterium]|nr:hypothetical protein [Defluviitaleaceae bacterium]MCL2240751.1 hypothetical protein [Defluviitaleaceae bacterium]